ncbi:thioredoxin-disulfide reductase [Eubacterium sp. AF15-50]|uniref:thioredoxin-disulfide reductase n=1 Tax=unclassified Eubacterium (in: firmicutes) TaxID=2624479 RepID=UPI000E482674|nr:MULTISPECIES: thioredoxin-disulfide reductase [unclassified Eubacterium (in: firmicutes)]RHR74221.1 thioredoxin-disulfide reductase [Eubacterium sp. AF16-48]RHR81755.1 thioredoxin-disulfide reductase [Eubacterium sp. AF15-50]
MYDVIVIGAGTAGMTAGIYARRAGKKVLIIEGKNYGGQIINTPEVENYPGISKVSGFTFANNLYNQTRELGTEFKFEEVIKIQNNSGYKVVVTNKTKYQGKTVIIATGAKNRPLGVNNEDKLTGAGVSYCATCDGAFFRGKDVAVVGGGNTALEDALFLSDYCNLVYVVHRRNEFRGEKGLTDILKEKGNVKFVFDSVVKSIKGEQSVEGLEILNVKKNTLSEIKVQGAFIAIGQMPDNEKFSDMVELDGKGYIKADETCTTNTEGVFVAGDCRTKQVRQLTTAASDGAVAALAACSYINKINQ